VSRHANEIERLRAENAQLLREREERRNRHRSDSSWLPSEALVGTVLVLCGLAIAVLILTGEIRLAVVP
jgi:hypothetical protein